MYWHGILDYDNRDNRKLAEVKDFKDKFRKLDPLCGSKYVAAFALIKDYDNEWDAEVDSCHNRVSRKSEKEIFIASELNHVPYDVVYLQKDSEIDDIRKYPVAFYPHPTLIDEKRVQLLKAYVENGGTIIIGCRSGYKDMNGRCVMMPQPGLLQELTGSDVRDFTFTSPAEEMVWAEFGDSKVDMPLFNDILEPLENTVVLVSYGNSYYTGKAAITEKRIGKGRVIHFGGVFSRSNVKTLFAYSGISEPFREYIEAPDTVEIIMRKKEEREFIFVLNYQSEEVSYILKKQSKMMYSGEMISGKCTLPAYGTAVYEVFA